MFISIPFTFQIHVKNRNGSRIVFDNPDKKKINLIWEQFFEKRSKLTTKTFDLDEHGKLVVPLKIARNELSFSIKVIVRQEIFTERRNHFLYFL